MSDRIKNTVRLFAFVGLAFSMGAPLYASQPWNAQKVRKRASEMGASAQAGAQRAWKRFSSDARAAGSDIMKAGSAVARGVRATPGAIARGTQVSKEWVMEKIAASPTWARGRIAAGLKLYATPSAREQELLDKWIGGKKRTAAESKIFWKFFRRALSTRKAIATIIGILMSIGVITGGTVYGVRQYKKVGEEIVEGIGPAYVPGADEDIEEQEAREARERAKAERERRAAEATFRGPRDPSVARLGTGEAPAYVEPQVEPFAKPPGPAGRRPSTRRRRPRVSEPTGEVPAEAPVAEAAESSVAAPIRASEDSAGEIITRGAQVVYQDVIYDVTFIAPGGTIALGSGEWTPGDTVVDPSDVILYVHPVEEERDPEVFLSGLGTSAASSGLEGSGAQLQTPAGKWRELNLRILGFISQARAAIKQGKSLASNDKLVGELNALWREIDLAALDSDQKRAMKSEIDRFVGWERDQGELAGLLGKLSHREQPLEELQATAGVATGTRERSLQAKYDESIRSIEGGLTEQLGLTSTSIYAFLELSDRDGIAKSAKEIQRRVKKEVLDLKDDPAYESYAKEDGPLDKLQWQLVGFIFQTSEEKELYDQYVQDASGQAVLTQSAFGSISDDVVALMTALKELQQKFMGR